MAARRFSREELEAFHGATVDDLVGPQVKLLFVGINPGLWTAVVNAHFARPGNRFWPAIHRAGITAHQIDASGGLSPQDTAELIGAGVGISNIVPVATARADELTHDQLRVGGERLRAFVRACRPKVVAVLGKTAFARAFGVRKLVQGKQPEPFEGAELWVLPNPSGLNAHDTVDSLAAAYRDAAAAAGVRLHR